jgi:prepilin-type N-terminal cleavage/methylation domain-containing protein
MKALVALLVGWVQPTGQKRSLSGGFRCASPTLRGRERRATRRGGFTLVELLVVILIILLVSAIALPSIISAVGHRQVSEAARILQAAIVGARDSAIKNNAPSGIRLLPDPTINGINPSTGLLDPTYPLAMSRIVPLESAPDYAEGKISIIRDHPLFSPFPAAPTWGYPYPYPSAASPTGSGTVSVLMVEECPIDTSQLPAALVPNAPTSWFWNIRIGDKIRIDNSGQSYTVVGPMLQANPELFVNDGAAGTATQLVRQYTGAGTSVTAHVEYLFLVNGDDDNNDGFIDNGWDGVDNNLDGFIDISNTVPPGYSEWLETETWSGALAGRMSPKNAIVTSLPPVPPNLPTQGILNLPYLITRRPMASPGSREVSLPSNMVIDVTTWATTHERSRFPLPPSGNGTGTSQVVNPNSGSVDIVVYPDGSVVPSTVYSSPSSFGLNGSFLHFWLAERGDVAAPVAGTYSNLPLPTGLAPTNFSSGAELKGEYSLVTIYSRTGQIVVNTPPRFDNPFNPANGIKYSVDFPFVEAQQGVRGGSQ